MMHLLLGTWPRRLATLAVTGLSFAVSLTLALAVGVCRAPASADAARRVPLLGPAAVRVAEWRGAELNPDAATPVQEDIETFRDLRPLTAEEIASLIRSLKDQRDVYLAKMTELDETERRLALYRQELADERKQLDVIKQQVAAQWDELRKARESLTREVTDLDAVEAANLRQLAKTYESMKPDRAAAAVKELDQGTATKLIYLMSERNAAKVLESLDQESAAQLTQRMTLLKRAN